MIFVDRFQIDLHYGNVFEEDQYVRYRFQQYYQYIVLEVDDKTRIIDVGGYVGDMLQLLLQNCHKHFDYHLIMNPLTDIFVVNNLILFYALRYLSTCLIHTDILQKLGNY